MKKDKRKTEKSTTTTLKNNLLVAFVNSNKFIYAARLVVFCVAIAFVVVGIFNGDAGDVLMKAINICTECIGLG